MEMQGVKAIINRKARKKRRCTLQLEGNIYTHTLPTKHRITNTNKKKPLIGVRRFLLSFGRAILQPLCKRV